MFKNILLPLDGSVLSEQPIRQLPHVADEKAIVHLVQVVSVPKPRIEPESIPATSTVAAEQLLNEARAYLNGKANELRLVGFNARATVLIGDEPAFQIISYANQKGVDLIAMSTHGRGGLSKLVFGSVTNEVIKRAPCPVLVLRAS